MRHLLNKITILEDVGPNTAELNVFKSVIASKIKELPADDATAKTLKEIEELLQHVNAGGRMGMIRGQLHEINDPAVMAAQKRLAQYIASMECTPEDRAELFRLWKSDKLVNIDALLSKKQQTFTSIFARYGENQAITEFIDDVMAESALGQGKGEFGLNVLSKSVAKPGGLGDFTDKVNSDKDVPEDQKGKGDLIVKQGGKWRKVECKTTHGGAARFSDQEVRPAEGYEAAASKLNAFVTQFKGTTMYQAVLPKGMAKGYGLNLRSAIALYDPWLKQGQYGNEYLALVENVITLIFGGPQAEKSRIKAIMAAFKAGNANEAMQQYAQASFAYYMSKKDDDGVLAIDLNERTFMFYSNAEELAKEKLRFNADTVYLTAKDVARGAYPQMSVQTTTFGANAKAAAEKQEKKDATKAAKANPVEVPGSIDGPKREVEQQLQNYAENVAAQAGIFDPNLTGQIVTLAMGLLQDGADVPVVKAQVKALVAQAKQLAAPPAAPATQAQPPATQQAPAATVQPTAESIRFGRQRRA